MSLVSYNGVFLPYPFHTDFRQEATYDDLSNTDRVLTTFDIKVQCVIHSSYLNLLAPDIDGQTTNPADIQNIIHLRLMQPRRQLSIKCNGKDLIPAAQLGNAGTVDAANGPQPQSCTITDITNTSFMLSYHIIAHYWLQNLSTTGSDLSGINAQSGDVLYNRWQETIDIDHANYTTRTREGKFVIRSDNIDGKIADQLRIQMAVVGVPDGFLRQSSQWIQDPNGLGVRYRVVDREVFRKPPLPAFRAEGRFTQSSTRFGAWQWLDCFIRLEGDKLTEQRLLVEAAVTIVARKLKTRMAPIASQSTAVRYAIPTDCSFTTDMYNNIVEAKCRAIYPPSTTPTGKGRMQAFWGFDWKRLLEPPDPNGADQNYQPNYLARGSAGRLLQAAAYFDPNLSSWLLNQSSGQLSTSQGQGNGGFQVGQAGQTSEVTAGTNQTGPLAADDNPKIGQEQGLNFNVLVSQVNTGPDESAQWQNKSSDFSFFTDYLVTSKYESDKHIYMMPISSPNGLGPNSPQGPGALPGGTLQNNPTGQTVAFVQLASPTLLWIADWTAAKLDECPQIPDPNQTADQNWILLDEHYEPASIHLTNDGLTAMYRISGTYVYGHLNPNPQVTRNLAFGRPPFVVDSFTRTVPDDRLERSIIDSDELSQAGVPGLPQGF